MLNIRQQKMRIRRSQILAPYQKEPPQDAAIPSHKLLIQGSFIHKTSAGVYSLLPMGYRSMTKLIDIIDDEMLKIGISFNIKLTSRWTKIADAFLNPFSTLERIGKIRNCWRGGYFSRNLQN